MPMTHDQFRIGLEFWCGATPWRCTDVGSRVVVAISLGPHEVVERGAAVGPGSEDRERRFTTDDPDWLNGPPYAVVEHVFDEHAIEACSLVRPDEADETQRADPRGCAVPAAREGSAASTRGAVSDAVRAAAGGAAGQGARSGLDAAGGVARSVRVRVLGAADVASYRAMLEVFAEAFEDGATYLERQPDDEYVRRLLSDGNFRAIVAESHGEVVGALAGYVLPKFEQPRCEFYIYDLAVAEAHRRRGVATAMIDELKAVCAERGVYVIYVQADHGDDPAVALYTKLGVREDVMHFDIEPGGGQR